MFSINRILVPVNFQSGTEEALSTAKGIAKRQHSEVFLLHVIDSAREIDGESLINNIINGRSPALGYSLDKLSELENKLARVGIKSTSLVRQGSIVGNILHLVKTKGIDLMVLGIRHHSFFDYLFGMIKKLIDEAPCPILTVPRKKEEFKRVLIPVLQFNNAIEKYEYARPIIKRNKAFANLTAFLSSEAPVMKNSLILLLELLEEKLRDDLIPFESSASITHDFSHSVLKSASEDNSDLIVLPDSIRQGIPDYIFGSSTHRIVNNSPVPVLSINSRTAMKDL